MSENENWVKELVNNKTVKNIVYLLFALLCILIFTGLLTNKHIKIFGIEFNGSDTVVKYVNTNQNIDTFKIEKKTNDTNSKIKFVEKKENSKAYLRNVNLGKDTSKSNFVFNEKLVGTNIQVGNENVQNNYGIQPRKIDKNYLRDFFVSYPDKSIRIGFIAANSEGEIINLKNQIISILSLEGYTNIEKINGIRIMIDSNLSTEGITLLPNQLGGVSFFIPSATK